VGWKLSLLGNSEICAQRIRFELWGRLLKPPAGALIKELTIAFDREGGRKEKYGG
jgi:hypothetical protein